MHATPLPQPGLIWGLYPENRNVRGWADRLAHRLRHVGLRHYEAIGTRSIEIEAQLRGLSDAALGEAARGLRAHFARDGLDPTHVAQAFALTGEACRRRLGVSPFSTQRIAAAILLDNRLAEMATGEGKTLAAALAAASAALAGIPVHVLTANDYLVARDAERLQPVYAALGLTTGTILQPMDAAARRSAYASDIAYCTAKELLFDYLRDQPLRSAHRTDLAWRADRFCAAPDAPAPLLRGLCMAILDEADSLLLDEASVPFVIAEQRDHPAAHAADAALLAFARTLHPGRDFAADPGTHAIELTAAGRAALDAADLSTAWRGTRHREAALHQALAALHLLQRDRDYLVRDGTIQLIDGTTGRIAPGRTWSRGLHGFVELKEGCRRGSDTVTRAQLTYQRFFPRYLRLCGMSGTLAEARGELARVYGLSVVRVPLRTPGRRRHLGQRVLASRAALWRAVAHRAAACAQAGQPVLIGTDSVADAADLSAWLTQASLPHVVLDARNDRHEADIVAGAGQPGRITVATQMAGRGTDIPLAPGVEACGGLHVVVCQLNPARRIDRQLVGRCARQGDPGSVEILRALDAPLLQHTLPAWLLRAAAASLRADGCLPGWLGRLLTGLAQWRTEARQRRQRAQLQHADAQRTRMAAFRD